MGKYDACFRAKYGDEDYDEVKLCNHIFDFQKLAKKLSLALYESRKNERAPINQTALIFKSKEAHLVFIDYCNEMNVEMKIKGKEEFINRI